MLLLFNKIVKPLNQFAKKKQKQKQKKNPKEVSVFGATADNFLYRI